ncbi:DMT family transporter [Sphingobium sp. AN641]|uniref:DMT family transporter n=1 Tax=Sphingobium sp. AN641 TaxID=3133443 RepID=UPI0030C2F014
MGLRLLAMVFLSAMFAGVKMADARGVHLIESLFYRQALALPLVFAWVAWSDGAGAVRTSRIGIHASRAALGMVGMILNFGSFILLPLTEATSIGFTMPIFGTILSALILREATGWYRWGAVLLGFAGVLVMVRPDVGHVPLTGLAVALSAAILTACISLVLRELGRTERPGVVVFWFTALSVPPLGMAMLFVGQAHDPVTWGLLLFIGIVGGLAQLCMTGALRWAPVSVVLPMDYSSIIWATLIGWLVWDDWPLATTWAGAALIVTSGLTIAWREHVRARRVRP